MSSTKDSGGTLTVSLYVNEFSPDSCASLPMVSTEAAVIRGPHVDPCATSSSTSNLSVGPEGLLMEIKLLLVPSYNMH